MSCIAAPNTCGSFIGKPITWALPFAAKRRRRHRAAQRRLVVEAQIDSITDAELSAFAGKRHAAIFCCNDMIAVRMWHRLNRLGLRMPEDMLLAGFNGDGHGRMVDLTTAAFDGEAVGAAAFVEISPDFSIIVVIAPPNQTRRDARAGTHRRRHG